MPAWDTIPLRPSRARLLAALLLFAGPPLHGEDFLDRVEQKLTWNAFDGRLRSRLSGTLDLEGYDVQLPAPGVLHTDRRDLVHSRLAAFLDVQIGPHLYAFAQARADQGFDPGERNFQVRLDEYAVRLTPWLERRFNVQVGKFGTVVGNWMPRHASWGNPFITAPLPYEYLTGIWDVAAARTSGVLLGWSHVRPNPSEPANAAEKSLRLPIVWGPAYSTGLAVSGELGKFRYALELKHAALSSRPDTWSHPGEEWAHPTVGARVGYRPNPMWDFGFSASGGSYLRAFARPTVAPGHDLDDYRELVLGHDISFAWHHLQVWAEIYAARFEVPAVGRADTVAYYAELKYKLTPRLFAAVRWNQQVFGTIPHLGRPVRWGHDLWRIDFAPGYRFTPHTQLKLQYSLQRGDSGPRDHTRTLATQLTVRF